jgi:hypothetical protein
MVWPVVAAVAAPIIMNEISKAQSSGDEKKAARLMREAYVQYGDAIVPEIEKYDPELMTYLGDVKLDEVSALGDLRYQDIGTDFDNVSVDPNLIENQQASLGALDEIIEGGGMNAMDKANMSRIQGEVSQADRGRREAINQNMQMRGVGGSGMELLAQLQSSQAATDRANQSGLDIAGMAQQRALESIMNKGNLSGDMRSQEFGEKSNIASARDAIEKFNAANRLGVAGDNRSYATNVAQGNADTRNQATMANWGARQDMANQNVATKNAAQTVNRDLAQQKFDNDMAIRQARANALSGQAGMYQGRATAKADNFGKVSNAAVQGGIAAYGAYKDDDKKKDVT